MTEQDKLIAEWLGCIVEPLSIARYGYCWMATPENITDAKVDGADPFVTLLPHYTTSDADAISLLPVLVERGWLVNLSNTPDGWRCMIHKGEYGEREVFTSIKSTIAAAITTAIIQLIESEATL